MSSSVACIDYRNGKFLIAKRLNTGDMANRWEFPGGKIEEGESFEQAIKREMMEEFSCEAEVFEQLAQGTFYHKNKECSLNAFRVELKKDGINEKFVLSEHSEIAWVSASEIEKFDFVDSDLSIFPKIKKSLGIE